MTGGGRWRATPRGGRPARTLLAALAALAGAACGEAPPPARHVLVILVDTLRADHTSLAGYSRDTTPRLRALAEEGTVFARHLANAPWTKPSVASLLTGLLPPAHGSQWGDVRRAASGEVDVLAPGFDTLPEILSRHGYATVALMTNTTLTPALGYAQGYDRYEQLTADLDGDRTALRVAAETLDAAQRPTFVWCHLMAPHNYKVPEGWARTYRSALRTPIRRRDPLGWRMLRAYRMRYREQVVDAYDEVLRWVDRGVGELIERVRARHPDALVVFTSDHGEELGDHGGYLHARTLHNEILHVPLVLWGPGVAPGRVETRLSQSIDLLPTVLDAVGLEADAAGQGRSLLAPAAGETLVYAEKRNGSNAMRALIREDGKLLESKPPGPPGEKPPIDAPGRWHFYADPLGPDLVDRVGALPPAELAARRAQLESTWADSIRVFGERAPDGSARRPIRDDEIEALRQLGYVE